MSRPNRPATGTTAGTRWSSQPATQVPEIRPPGNSIRGPAEALHQPIHHQRDPDRVGNVKTNRTQRKRDATVDEHNPLHTLRLQVLEPNDTTSP
jgi:hypothetical protein